MFNRQSSTNAAALTHTWNDNTGGQILSNYHPGPNKTLTCTDGIFGCRNKLNVGSLDIITKYDRNPHFRGINYVRKIKIKACATPIMSDATIQFSSNDLLKSCYPGLWYSGVIVYGLVFCAPCTDEVESEVEVF